MKKISIIILTIYCLFSSYKGNAQWERVRSFTGGQTNAMAKDSNTIYACVNGFGLVKSTDDGDHWNFVDDSISPSLGGEYGYTSISAEGNKILYFHYPNTIKFSNDSGITWQNISVTGTSGFYDDVKIYKGKIFATNFEDVYISDDDGSSWVSDSVGSNEYKIEISEDRIFLVPRCGATSCKLYTSLDTGITWINLGPTGTTFYSSFSAKGDTLVIASLNQQLRISTDLGANWTTAPCPPIDEYSFPLIYLDNNTLYFINNDSIFNSYNLGTTWNFLTLKLGLKATSMIKTGNDFLSGSYNYAFVKFSPLNNSTIKKAKEIFGINALELIVKGDTLMALCSGTFYYYSHDNGANWNNSYPFYSSDYYDNGPIAYDSGAVYACIYNKVFRSMYWGMSWMLFDTIPQYVRNMICYKGSIFYATDSGIYRGFSQGGTAIKYGSLNTKIVALAAGNNKLFAVSQDSVYSCVIDTNPQWMYSAYGLPNSNNFYLAAASDTAVFIGGNKGVYRCYPPDTTWSYTGLFNKNVNDLSCFNNDAFATSSVQGVTILRNDTGSVWDPINFGLNDYMPTQVAAGDSFLFCGGNYHGLFRRLRDQVQYPAGINENNFVDDFYFSISPNPASDMVKITGNVESGNTKLNLIDITGRICFTKTVSSKGNFSFNIMANSFSDGIYFVNMFDGKRKYSGKVLIQH